MKHGILAVIRIYQVFISPIQILFPAAGCRFWPNCSEYTHGAIKRYGAIKGMRLGISRILKCNPWN